MKIRWNIVSDNFQPGWPKGSVKVIIYSYSYFITFNIRAVYSPISGHGAKNSITVIQDVLIALWDSEVFAIKCTNCDFGHPKNTIIFQLSHYDTFSHVAMFCSVLNLCWYPTLQATQY